MTYTRRNNQSSDFYKSGRKYRGGHNGNFNPRVMSSRVVKKLDPNLFIRKIIDKENQVNDQEFISNFKFSSFNIVDKLKSNIESHGYEAPTPIQEQSIPYLLMGRDIIGLANTGTGKTAAFLISLINKSVLDRNQRTLIVVPTRELATQITDEFEIFAKGLNLNAVAAIGGMNIKRQTYALRHKPHFVIGTPGRLKDLIERNALSLNQFQNIVLDEVDRMVDIGFLNDIKKIISLLPKVRQSLFFSATIDEKTQEILQKFVINPIKISVSRQETGENIEQDIVRITGARPKVEVLHDLLIKPEFDKVIVFGRTKRGMEKLTHALIERGFKAAAIHGNKSQNQRQRALTDFKENKIKILIATDVAARGIDIENLSHVINYDAPTSYEEYIHRIGRTGRAGKRGVALTFVE